MSGRDSKMSLGEARKKALAFLAEVEQRRDSELAYEYGQAEKQTMSTIVNWIRAHITTVMGILALLWAVVVDGIGHNNWESTIAVFIALVSRSPIPALAPQKVLPLKDIK